MTISVVDLFAGAGGLGEGFAGFGAEGRRRFSVAMSIEMDRHAITTLRLRALQRVLLGKRRNVFTQALSSGDPWKVLIERFPLEAAAAQREALQIELGPSTSAEAATEARRRTAANKSGATVLVGGPPCQAYSLMGRARNRGVVGYRPDKDKRQVLYVEYLQFLSALSPDVFVMENVKGLLSAELRSSLLFARITDDLSDPSKAVEREGRSRGRNRPKYDLFSLVVPSNERGLPSDFLVRSEEFSVPQSRHRVVILGVRRGLGRSPSLLSPAAAQTVEDSIRQLPALRSGLGTDASGMAGWRRALCELPKQHWFSSLDKGIRSTIKSSISDAGFLERGHEVTEGPAGEIILNHSARSHMREDLWRYLFASSFALKYGESPKLAEFPRELLPNHRSAQVLGQFTDRFRVQCWHRPASTITAHISKDGHYFIHPDVRQARSLTVREAASLQTFPSDYFFSGPRTEQYRQVGNAVPPKLAMQIARIVHDLLAPS